MTLRSAILAAVTGETAQETDPYYNLVSLHLKGDVNTGRTYNAFSDASSNNFRLTNSGDVRGSSFSPYGTSWSGFFDGTGDYLTTSNSAGFATGTSNLTIEWWMYTTTTSVNQYLFDTRDPASASSAGIVIGLNTAGKFFAYIGGSAIADPFNTVVTANTWTHIALVRSSNSWKLFVNGTADSVSPTNATSMTQQYCTVATLAQSRDTSSTNKFNGYLSNIRFVNNRAVYTSNFTPSTSPLTRTSGGSDPPQGSETVLLACQSGRFLDSNGANVSATSPLTINVFGDTRISSFSPFLETDTTTGSGYFDGTGDYLTLGDNAAMELLNNNFTIEFWINTTTSAQYDCVIGRELTTPGTGMWSFQLNSGSVGSGDIAFWSWDYNSFSAPMMITSGVSLRDGAWHHVAVVRNGSAWAIYIDGVPRATQTSSITIGNIGLDYWIGNNQANTTRDFLGYLSNFRYVVGVAVYTGNFTPPAAPLTATQSAGTNIQAIPQFVYATFDSSASSVTLSNGNLTLTGVGGSGYNKANTTTAVSSGKWYFEATLVSAATDTSIGISQGNSSSTYPGQEATSYAYILEKGQKFNGNSTAAYAASLAAGDVFMCAFDLDNNKLFFGKNGSWFASSDPVTGANPAFTLSAGTYRAVGRPYSTNTVTFNFGASAFAYTPPTGFVGLRGPATQLLTLQERGAYNTVGFQDESEYQHIITRPSGTNVAQGTFSPFSNSGWSNLFNGSTDCLSVASHADFNFGSGNFTAECWVNWNTASGNADQVIFAFGSSGQTEAGFRLVSNNTIVLDVDESVRVSYSFVPTVGTWYHFAVVRDAANTYKIYQDGVLKATGTYTYTQAQIGLFIGGINWANNYGVNGYISNFRAVKGVAVYTGAFTPPTAPLTTTQSAGTNISAITGSATSILTLQSNRFVDNSVSPKTITVVSAPRVTPFSPFAPVAYDPQVHGGSAYFDGSGDYLSVAYNPGLQLGALDFTIEFWFYSTGAQGVSDVLANGYSSGTNLNWLIQADGSTMKFYASTTGNSWAVSALTVGAIVHNQWNHFAIVRSGTTVTPYLNGVAGTTGSLTGSIFANTSAIAIGTDNSSPSTNNIQGYIGPFRIVRGTAVYTSNFTPPSGPLPLLGNTSLLLNFTNAGVIDSTGKNVIETVGNSGVVTALKKYGSGSMYFDGTSDQQKITPKSQVVLGNSDWTVEFWAYTSATPAGGYCGRFIYPSTGFFIRNTSGTVIDAGHTGSGVPITTASGVVVTNTWQHIALAKSGTTANLYVNGVCRATGSWTWNEDLTEHFYIGSTYVGQEYFNGYIDDFRVTRGLARYTGSTVGTTYFTPPTKALPDRGTLSTLTVDMAAPSSVDYLVVAGGGGGAPSAASGVGSTRQAGAGAGGFRTGSSSVSSGVLYPLTIGAGGSGGTAGSWNPNTATNGSNSTFSSITSAGGGRGGTDAAGTSGNGGSGGGSSYPGRTRGLGNTPASSSPPDTNAVQGYDGADAPQGGGGGAGGAGQAGGSTTGGNGGIAASSSITGVQVYYAGGGGGGDFTGGVAGLGGGTSTASQKGGGGNGGLASNGVDGSLNTGGGGGGAAVNSGGTYKGGEGGSGVVILAYPTSFRPLKASLGLVYTIDTVTRPGYRVYKFTAGTGSISW